MKEFFRRFLPNIEASKKKKRTEKSYKDHTEIVEYSHDGHFKVRRLVWNDGRGRNIELLGNSPESIGWNTLFQVHYSQQNEMTFISVDGVCRNQPSQLANVVYDNMGIRKKTHMWSWNTTTIPGTAGLQISNFTQESLDFLGLQYEDELPQKLDVQETLKHFQKQLVAGDFSAPILFPAND